MYKRQNEIVSTNELALQTADELADELNKFRTEWKRELNETTKRTDAPSKGKVAKMQVETGVLRARKPASVAQPVSSSDEQPVNESNGGEDEKAMYLFGKGVLLEQQGRHYEAIQFYRMSMQLDPDIEFKMNASAVASNARAKQQASSTNQNARLIVEDVDDDKNAAGKEREEEEEDVVDSLLKQFQQIAIADNKYCEKNVAQKATHFSQLPIEVIMLIFKWAVSDQLDMRTLESLSMVCKGFYVCARDPEIWRLACIK